MQRLLTLHPKGQILKWLVETSVPGSESASPERQEPAADAWMQHMFWQADVK